MHAHWCIHVHLHTQTHKENQKYEERHCEPQATSLALHRGGVVCLQGQRLQAGPQDGCGQHSLPTSVGPLPPSPRAGHRDSVMPSQYLLLLHLPAVWLHPEDPPGLRSCAEGPGKSPSLRWSHWPAPGSGQPGAGRAACSSPGSESGQGRGRSDMCWSVPRSERGEGAPSCAPALVLENTISKENSGVSPIEKMWVRVNLWEPLILMVLWGDPRNPR